MEGGVLITTCLAGYYILFFSALRLPKEDILLAVAMLIISLALVCVILTTIATYPMYVFYKNNKKIVDSLNNFSIK